MLKALKRPKYLKNFKLVPYNAEVFASETFGIMPDFIRRWGKNAATLILYH